MIFEWDEVKRGANLMRHGIDFLDAALLSTGATSSRRKARSKTRKDS